MLSTTCWVIVGQSQTIEVKVYLFKKDAELALDILKSEPTWAETELHLVERPLVLAFGVTDQRIAPEDVYPHRVPATPCYTYDVYCFGKSINPDFDLLLLVDPVGLNVINGDYRLACDESGGLYVPRQPNVPLWKLGSIRLEEGEGYDNYNVILERFRKLQRASLNL